MLSIASAPLFPVSFLIHCQPDSHETPHIQCFCFCRSPFTSFPAIVLSSSGQLSKHQRSLATHITQATSHCCTLCLIWIATSDALLISKISSKHLSLWTTKDWHPTACEYRLGDTAVKSNYVPLLKSFPDRFQKKNKKKIYSPAPLTAAEICSMKKITEIMKNLCHSRK